MNFKESVNTEKFLIFLETLRAKYFFDDLYIFMDNMGAHRSHIVRQRLDELSIDYIFCPPYSPELNPIENIWGIAKNKLKKERL